MHPPIQLIYVNHGLGEAGSVCGAIDSSVMKLANSGPAQRHASCTRVNSLLARKRGGVRANYEFFALSAGSDGKPYPPTRGCELFREGSHPHVCPICNLHGGRRSVKRVSEWMFFYPQNEWA